MEDLAISAPVDSTHKPCHGLPNKKSHGAGVSQQSPADSCFDCNICLDFATDPVVTLCGHLYCWPCIYMWLRRDYTSHAESDPDVPRQQQCPVCKAAISESALVPLYGRGGKPTLQPSTALAVPRRPMPSFVPLRQDSFDSAAQSRPQPHNPARQASRDYVDSVISSTTVVHPLFHGVAMLPFLLCRSGATAGAGSSSSGLYYADPYHAAGRGAADRRHEMQSARSLNRVSCFLFLCVLLCLLLF